MTVEANWNGVEQRECGEHQSTGRRAWCFGCTEWCYGDIPCRGCELPGLRAEIKRLKLLVGRGRLAMLGGLALGITLLLAPGAHEAAAVIWVGR